MTYEINCQFSVPVNLGTEELPDFEYSIIDCQNNTTTIELVENPYTGASFYIRQEVSYGDFLVLTFLLIFAIFGIVKVISDFFLPKRIEPPHY